MENRDTVPPHQCTIFITWILNSEPCACLGSAEEDVAGREDHGASGDFSLRVYTSVSYVGRIKRTDSNVKCVCLLHSISYEKVFAKLG